MFPLLTGFVLLLAISTVEGSPVYKSGLKRDYCSWGAQYWCSSPKTAVLCKKTEWCTANVWSHDISEDVPCVITQKLVKFFRSAIASSDYEAKTEYDLALKIAKGCSLFTDSTERQQCKAIVTKQDSLLKLIQLVDSSLPTKAVALAVGTCRRYLPKQSCTKCDDVVSTAQTYIRIFYTAEVNKKVFEAPCAKLKQGKSVCLALAEFHYTQFYEGLLKASPKNVCKGFTECFTSPLHEIKQTSDLCSTCKNVVADIRALDRSSEVQGVIRSLVKSVCTELGPFEQMCDVLADEGLQYLFELIATEMEPDVLCEKIDLCKLAEKTKEPISKVAIPNVKTGVPCIVCQMVLTEVENYLHKNSTEKTLEDFIGDICNRLPPTVSDQCNTFVSQYSPIIIKLLEDKVQPDVLCYTLTLCKNSSSTQTKSSANPSENQPPKDELCNLCEYVVTYIETFLAKNASQEEIEAVLEKVCELLPADINGKCDNIVKTYAPIIVSLLLQDLDPTSVCKDIGLCPQNKASPVQQKPKVNVKGPVCALCEFVIQELDNYLAGNYSQAKIEAALEKVCTIIPSTIRDECTSFVATYGPLIIQLLLQEVQPQKLCGFFSLCSVLTVTKPATAQIKGELCEMCKYVVTYIDTFLEKNDTQVEIEALLDKVCTILPSSLSSECEQIVQQYGPVIIQLLIQELDPSQICTLIGLCAKNKVLTVTKPVTAQIKGELCDMCKYVVTYIDTFLEKNSTQVEIEALLDKVCKILPSSLSSDCEQIVQQYGPVIIQLLIQELDPSQICTLFGLCAKNKASPVQQTLKVNAGPMCALCEFVIQELDNLLAGNYSQAKIEAALEKVCDILPKSLTAECKELVRTYGPLIIQLLLQEVQPQQLCTAVHLCSVARPKTLSIKLSGPSCVLCEMIMKEINTLLSENSTEAEIEAKLDKVCDLLPATLKSECENMVQQYAPAIIKMLANKIDPKKICTFLGLCNNTFINFPPPAKISNNPKCVLCEFIMKELDGLLAQNRSEAWIASALQKVCYKMPETVNVECLEFVQIYGPLIIQMLINRLQPDQICQALQMCPKPSQISAPVNGKTEGPLCAICEYIIQALDTILEKNSTQAKIEDALNKVCNYLPTSLTLECQQFVDQYGPLIITLLLQDLQPQQICTALKLCTSSRSKKLSIKLSGPSCAMCEFIMQELISLLNANNTEAEIEAKLDIVCDLLPETLKSECENMVQQYAPAIIKMLANKIDPKKICTFLGLCNDTLTNLPLPVKISTSPICVLCEFIMKELDGLLAQNRSEAWIESALQKVCYKMPKTLTKECENFVNTYGPLIIQMLIDRLQPDQICQVMKLCTKPSQISAPVNEKTEGPLCAICEYIIQALDTILEKNSTEAKIGEALNKVCNYLPTSLTSECQQFVDEYGQMIINVLLQEMKPQLICTALKLCTSSRPKTLSIKLSGPSCAMCEFMMTELVTLLDENTTEAAIQAKLEQVCDVLPSTLKSECESVVEQYSSIIIHMIASKIDPQKVCSILGLCKGSAKVMISQKPSVKKGEFCDLCSLVFNALDSLLTTKASEQEILAALDKVCSLLHPSLKEQCESFVSLYLPYVLDLIVQELTPEKICEELGLCARKLESASQLHLTQETSVTVKKDELCAVCIYVFEAVYKLLSDNKSIPEIENALDKVCDLLGPLKDQCEKLVALYAPYAVDLIVKELTPQMICNELKLCTNSTHTVINPQAKSDVKCAICELVLKGLEMLIAKNTSEKEIESALEAVCDILPAEWKKDCVNFVKTYTLLLVNLLSHFPPNQVCEMVKMCTPPPKELKQIKNGPMCPICEFVMNELEDLLSKNASEQEIVAALEKVCSILPDTVKKECDSFIENYAPILIQLLLKMTPDQVCSYLKFCTNTTKELKQRKNGPMCPICEFVMNEMEELLSKNATEQEIVAALEKICNILPSTLKQECDSFIEDYAPILIQLLLKMTPDQVCSYLKFCTNTTKVHSELKQIKNGPMCPICEFVMNEMEELLSKNATEQEIVAALEKVCNILPSTLKQECDSFIEDYAPILIQLLLKMTPDQVCSYLKFCTNTTKESNHLKNGPMCPICEFVMNEMDSLLSKNASETEIVAALEKVCNILPDTVRKECDSYVEAYTPILIQLLLKMTPDQVCSYLKFCTNTTKELKQIKNGPMCPICEFVMNELEALLSKNATEQEIVAALEKICNILPSTLKQECDSFIEDYAPILIQLLLKMTPDQVCSYLKFCTNTTKELKQIKNGPMCPICEFVMNEMEELLSKNATEQEIVAALEKICNILPSTLKQECDSFIEDYAPILIQLLLKMTPDQVCSYLKFCTNTTKVHSELKQIKNGPMCPICEFVMNEMEELLSKNATEQEIVAALEKVCNILPSTLKQECDSFIEDYAPILIQLLLKMTPDQVCSYLKFCTNTTKESNHLKNGPMCPICEFVMNEMDSLLSKNASETEIVAALEKVCNILPDTVRKECDSYVEAYTPILIQLLLKMTPDQVCSYLKFCTNTTKELKQIKNGPMCPICEFVMNELEALLSKNATEQEIVAALEKICNILPSTLKQECDSFIEDYAPILIQLLLKMTPDQVCSYLKFCTNTTKELKQIKNGPMCPICEFVMNEMEELLSKNATEQEIVAALEKICNILPSTLKQECDSFIEDYAPILIQLLLKMTPDQVCSYLKFCTNTTKELKQIKNGPMCPICEFVMNEMEELLSKNATEQEIVAALEKICNILPSTLKQECDSFIEDYAPILIQLLLKMTPDQVCSYLKFCTNTTKELKQIKNGPMCPICEFVMNEMEELLSKNATEQEIVAALEKICNILPSTLKQECDSFIEDYAPILIQLLLKMTPDQVCSYLKFCTNTTKELKQIKNGPMCPICEFVMNEMEELLSKNATEQEIVAALEKVCNILPSTLKQECDSFIEDYAPILIQLLLKMTPDQVCSYLKFCTNTTKANVAAVQTMSSGSYCVLCEFILKKLDGFLSKNLTQSELEKALDMVCFLLPGTLEKDCEKFVTQYEPVLMKLLLQEIKPRQVCLAANFCPNKVSQAASNSLTFKSEKSDAPSTTPVFMEHCSECKFAFYEVQTALADPYWLTKAKSISSEVCKLLKSGQDECASLLESNYATVVNDVVAFRFPIEFCQKINLCEVPPLITSGQSNHKELTLTIGKDGPATRPAYMELEYCSECKLALRDLQTALGDPFWQIEFKASLEVLCTYLKTGQDTCNSLVQDNFETLLNQIRSSDFPNSFCQKIDYCEYPPLVLTSNGVECQVCEVLIQLLDIFLQANKTVTEVEKVFYAACDAIIPDTERPQCESMVRNYTPAFMQLLSQLDDPNKVCQATKLCPRNRSQLLKKLLENKH